MSQRGGPPQRPKKQQKNQEPRETAEQRVARLFAEVRNLKGILFLDSHVVLHDITEEEVRFAIADLTALEMHVDAEGVYAAIHTIRVRANSKAKNRSTVDKFKEKREEKRDKNDDSDDEEGGGASRSLLAK